MVSQQARLDVGGEMDTSGSELGGEGGRLGELVAVPVENVPLGAN
jgi:hypothetical protein